MPKPEMRLRHGFTLIELMVVISIMLILISAAIPLYSRWIVLSKEAVLRQQLFTLRLLIGQYTGDKQKEPASLLDLTTDKYIRQLPIDPFTGSAETWVAEVDDDPDPIIGSGIVDVHSGSSLRSSDGTPYSSW